jgi:hypothetical protein
MGNTCRRMFETCLEIQLNFNSYTAYFLPSFLLYYTPILTSPKVSHVFLPKLVIRVYIPIPEGAPRTP